MTTWYFDLDGTLADLYHAERWLEKLENEEAELFSNLETMIDEEKFKEWATERLLNGDRIEVITWLPRGASEEYEKICAKEKEKWVKQHFPFITEINCLSYGIPKQYAIKKRTSLMVLVDDNEEVLQMWETAKQRTGRIAKEFFEQI